MLLYHGQLNPGFYSLHGWNRFPAGTEADEEKIVGKKGTDHDFCSTAKGLTSLLMFTVKLEVVGNNLKFQFPSPLLILYLPILFISAIFISVKQIDLPLVLFLYFPLDPVGRYRGYSMIKQRGNLMGTLTTGKVAK